MKLITVRIMNSWNSDVLPGAMGIVTGEHAGGFAVKIVGKFTDAFGKQRTESRTMWFKREELDGLPEPTDHTAKRSKQTTEVRRKRRKPR